MSHGSGSGDELNNRPIIAILAQTAPNTDGQKSYIAASYVKDIESAGARVVPIPTSYDPSIVEELFHCVNGLLIPGGAAKLPHSPFYKNAKTFYDLAIEANQKGDYFPIWGTCLGFEALPIIVAGTKDVLTSRESLDVPLPLNFTTDAPESRLFRDMSPALYNAIASENITYNYHKYGFKPEVFESNMKLNDFFKVLSTNVDKSGETFVSTIEARDYPIYGVMWHPEKVNYEFKTSRQRNIPHTSNAVQTTQHMSRFFVNEARRSKHVFPSSEMEDKHLIYEHTPIRPDETLGHLHRNYELVYLF